LKNVLGQIEADCGNLHWVAPPISRYGHLQYGALRRRLEQEPSTPSAFGIEKRYLNKHRPLLAFNA
ncbi:MAG: hypothetical protein ABJH45_03725, partial [Paracoccaceae bacterium]